MKHRLLTSLALIAMGVPLVACAASKARQEYAQAVRLEPDLARGAELFETCAICHGEQGNGVVSGDVPRIAGQHVKVLIKQLVDFRHQQRWDVRMERFAGEHRLGDAQAIADVAAYVSQMDEPTVHGLGPGELVEHGAALYKQACESCHRPNGGGDPDKRVPRLAGQHYEYLLRQMHDTADGRRPNMSRSHARLLARMQYEDFVGLADFLSRAEWDAPAALAPQPVPAER